MLTVGIVIDDIDAGNTCLLVDGHMIIGNATTIFVGENATIAGSSGSLPNTFYDVTGILHRVVFAIELSPLTTHHIEQDTKLIAVYRGLWTVDIRLIGCCPILRTQSP